MAKRKTNVTRPLVAWTLIVKADTDEEAPLLSQALASINGYVDEIFIQLNAPKGKAISQTIRQIAETYTKEVFTYQWTGNFVDARNDIFSKVPKKFDWIGWMDTDDTVDNPEMIQPVIAIMPKDVNGISLLYDYEHDDYGNTTVSLLTNRIVRNNNTFTWKSSIDDDEVSVHEALTAKISTRSVYNDEIKLVHHADGKKRQASLIRNIKLLQDMYNRHKKKGIVDPRILYYLATHYFDAGQYDMTLDLLIEYLKLSGWSEERSDANYYIGNILSKRGKDKEVTAKRAYLEALGENPNNLKAYIGLAELDSKNERYDQAIEWLEKGNAIKVGVTKIVRHEDKYELYRLLAQSYANVGGKKLEDALKYANKALKLHTFDENAKENRDLIANLVKHRDDQRAAFRLIKKLESEKADVLPLIDSLPKDLQDTIPVVDARQRHTPPTKWGKKSIVIYVGQSPLGIWGPWSMNEGGVGGSEEAVIRLSEELCKAGWDVTVFGCPGERAGDFVVCRKEGKKKHIEGIVHWKQYWEMNAKDEFNILISWRAIHFYDYKFKAKKKYVWFHDIVPEEEITTDRIKHFDKAIFVSKYHSDRPEFKAIPNKKKFISANGIDPAEFVDKGLKRDKHRCVYMSANERGLEVLLEVWPDVKKAIPDATLDAYYGWHSYDAINRDNPERMLWKQKMIKKMKDLPGVTERGRVGQADLHKEIFKAGIFAYPCTFPEVSCITAMKAQAGGAIPVTSDFANLKDIIHYGDQVPFHLEKWKDSEEWQDQDIERYKKRLIGWLQYPEKQDRIRKEMMTWAVKNLTWKKVAEQWTEEMS